MAGGGGPTGGVPQENLKVVQKFHAALQQIRYVDKLVGHLEKFGSNPVHYTLPDAIAKGVPVFQVNVLCTNTLLL